MLSKEKIRLMTDLAIYEKSHEDSVFRVNEFYKSDYIVWHVLMAAVRYIFCMSVIIVLYVLFNSDKFFYNINLVGIQDTLRSIGIYCLTGLIIYCTIAAVLYTVRYIRAQKAMRVYSNKLRRMAKKYHYISKDR